MEPAESLDRKHQKGKLTFDIHPPLEARFQRMQLPSRPCLKMRVICVLVSVAIKMKKIVMCLSPLLTLGAFSPKSLELIAVVRKNRTGNGMGFLEQAWGAPDPDGMGIGPRSRTTPG